MSDKKVITKTRLTKVYEMNSKSAVKPENLFHGLEIFVDCFFYTRSDTRCMFWLSSVKLSEHL